MQSRVTTKLNLVYHPEVAQLFRCPVILLLATDSDAIKQRKKRQWFQTRSFLDGTGADFVASRQGM
jgi:hypothetical protein